MALIQNLYTTILCISLTFCLRLKYSLMTDNSTPNFLAICSAKYISAPTTVLFPFSVVKNSYGA